MTFKEYVTNLTQLLIENPELGEKKAVYAKDNEGNEFKEVYFSPSIGYFDSDGDFTVAGSENDKVNAVCIN